MPSVLDAVDVAGVRIAYQKRGAGPPLLLLHGAPSDSRVWRVELESLSDAFTVIAWDAPGCGESDDPPPDFRMAEYADCLSGFIHALGVQRPHLLGHSWGSTLAIEVSRRHPAAVRSLVLVGAYAGWAGSLPPDQVAQRLAFALQVAELPAGAFDPTTMSGLFSDVMPKDRAAELMKLMSETRGPGLRTMAHTLAEADLRDALPHIAVPTLLLYGDADERSPLNIARQLHASIPGSTLTVMPGLGHECFLESAEAFATEVRTLLSKVDG